MFLLVVSDLLWVWVGGGGVSGNVTPMKNEGLLYLLFDVQMSVLYSPTCTALIPQLLHTHVAFLLLWFLLCALPQKARASQDKTMLKAIRQQVSEVFF